MKKLSSNFISSSLFLSFAPIIIGLTGCVSAKDLYTVQATPDQEIVFEDGYQKILSAQANSVSAVLEKPSVGKSELIEV